MNNVPMLLIVFFFILLPTDFIFIYLYKRSGRTNRVASFLIGGIIGVISMAISMFITGEI